MRNARQITKQGTTQAEGFLTHKRKKSRSNSVCFCPSFFKFVSPGGRNVDKPRDVLGLRECAYLSVRGVWVSVVCRLLLRQTNFPACRIQTRKSKSKNSKLPFPLNLPLQPFFILPSLPVNPYSLSLSAHSPLLPGPRIINYPPNSPNSDLRLFFFLQISLRSQSPSIRKLKRGTLIG